MTPTLEKYGEHEEEASERRARPLEIILKFQ